MNRKTVIATVAAAALTITGAWAQPGQGQGMHGSRQMKMHKKGKKGKTVFLIPYGLPHYSKILMKMWDDPKLALTSEQKSKLEQIRNRTMSRIREIAPQVKKLTHEIVKEGRAGASAESLGGKVDTLASLKAKATKAQLQCIQETRAILIPEQLKYIQEKMRQKRKHRKHVKK